MEAVSCVAALLSIVEHLLAGIEKLYKLERNFQISKHHIISQKEQIDNGLYDRFG